MHAVGVARLPRAEHLGNQQIDSLIIRHQRSRAHIGVGGGVLLVFLILLLPVGETRATKRGRQHQNSQPESAHSSRPDHRTMPRRFDRIAIGWLIPELGFFAHLPSRTTTHRKITEGCLPGFGLGGRC